jgi:hypothetical protein
MLNENKLKQRPANSTYKKLAVQCLNQALCFISSLLLAESYVLRNSQLLVGAKRYKKPLDILASGLGDIEKTKMITSNNKSTYENKRT